MADFNKNQVKSSPKISNSDKFNENLKQKRKKTAAVITVAACAICVVGLFFMNIGELNFNFDFGKKETIQTVYDGKGQHRISLYEPDWESDIFKNEEWLGKNRYLTYTENGMSLTLVDYDYASCGKPVEMFGAYFDALMHGDADAVNDFYTESYFETHDKFDKITMQKLYNMEVEYISRSDITLYGVQTIQYTYRVTYMIMENDGTFRDDLVSDAMRSQYYTLVEIGDEIKISDISYIYPLQDS